MTHDEWEIERVKIQSNYLKNGKSTQTAMIYSRDDMYKLYGPQPPKEKKEGEESHNIFQKVGSIVTAPVKIVKTAVTGVTLLGLIKAMLTMKNFKFSLTSVITAIGVAIAAFTAAYNLALPDGITVKEWLEIGVAVVSGVIGSFKRTSNPSEL